MPNSLLACMAGEPLALVKHSYVDVGSVSILLATSNPVRRMLMLQNDGAEDVYFSFYVPAKLHQGIRLLANGASALFITCHSTLCDCDVYGITKPNKVSRILVTEGF